MMPLPEGEHRMPDFTVIEGGGPEKEERERQKEEKERERAREWARSDFSSTIREVAANVLRVVRGAGKPYELLVQMQEVVNKAVKYREVHGYYPSSDLIQQVLALYDEYEQQEERQRRQEISEESRNVLRDDGYLDRLYALHIIHRGALQVAASGLIGQDTQQRAGESELHRGLTMWQQWLEERDRKWRESERQRRETPKKKPPAQKPMVSEAESAPVPAKASEAPPARQSRRSRQQEAFSEQDLKELRRAIKAKDSKKISELTSKIGRRPPDY
jgi:hypothetical protein